MTQELASVGQLNAAQPPYIQVQLFWALEGRGPMLMQTISSSPPSVCTSGFRFIYIF